MPAIFYLHQQYRYHSPWVQLLTFSGTAYALIGAIGAALLAAAWPELMQQHMAASKEGPEAIVPLFSMITNVVTKGLWNILEVLFAAAWWIGFGLLLRRDYTFIGLLSIIAGSARLLNSVMPPCKQSCSKASRFRAAPITIFRMMGILTQSVCIISQVSLKNNKSVQILTMDNYCFVGSRIFIQLL